MGQCKKLTHLLYNKILEVIKMLGLATIHELATKDEVTIGGKTYKVKNLIAATDNETVVKARVILQEIAENSDLDVEISIVAYKR